MAPRDQFRRVTVGTPAPLRAAWTTDILTLAIFTALLPPLAVVAYERGTGWLPALAVAALVTFVWQAIFALARRRSMPADGIVTALAFALMVGPSVSLWQVALSTTFGIIVGEQVFGGRGHNFLHPAVVALAFLMFSFPNTVLDDPGFAVAIAVLPGAALLLFAGTLSWRVVVGAVVAVIAVLAPAGLTESLAGLTSGAFAFGLVFFAGDPVASASTNPGRWAYGGLFGGLTVLLAGAGHGLSLNAVIFAALLASILAPLIDQAAIRINMRRRRRRHG